MEQIERLNILQNKFCSSFIRAFISAVIGFHGEVRAQLVEQVYANPAGLSKLTDSTGRVVLLGRGVDSTDIIVSPNKRVAAWVNRISGDQADRVFIYQSGKVKYIKCEPSVRDFWFVGQGALIGVDCGGLHFAGSEALYSTAGLRKLAEFDQSKVDISVRPGWSN